MNIVLLDNHDINIIGLEYLHNLGTSRYLHRDICLHEFTSICIPMKLVRLHPQQPSGWPVTAIGSSTPGTISCCQAQSLATQMPRKQQHFSSSGSYSHRLHLSWDRHAPCRGQEQHIPSFSISITQARTAPSQSPGTLAASPEPGSQVPG